MYLTEEKLLQWSMQESTDLSSNAYHFIKDHTISFFKLAAASHKTACLLSSNDI